MIAGLGGMGSGIPMPVLPLVLVLVTFCARGHAAEVIPPKPQGTYVNDYARVLSSSTVADLNRQLNDFERQSSNQVLVVIYPKMQSQSSIEDYTVRVAQAWGVGRKDRRNGVILFIFTQDRKMRLEVGYGLEGALPDAISNRIIENEIAPRFRQNDYNGGVRAGVDAIMKATRGEYKGTGRTLGKNAQRAAWIGPVIIMVGIWIIAAWMRRQVRSAVFGGRGRYYRRGWGGGFWPGYYIGSGGWHGGSGGGWSSGGSSWGGGGGGGGFSAGGGSFGGGGASGSW